jgi:hypothetical protein
MLAIVPFRDAAVHDEPVGNVRHRELGAYLALPVTFATPSTRLISFPM